MKKGTIFLLSFAVVTVSLFLVFISPARAGEDITEPTEKGLFSVKIMVQDKELKPGKNTIELLIRDKNGRDVERAEITVTPWMPEMGHGVEIEPVISEKGKGLYTADNVYLSMSGRWELRIDVQKGDARDRVVFSFPHIGGIIVSHVHVHLTQEPAGVMGAHVHHAGKWMLSYQYMYMNMHGNRDGKDRVSTSDVLKEYMVAPTDMIMQMHMLGVMYTPIDKLTLMAMIPYLDVEMDHVNRRGVKFTTRSDGIGDVKVSALYSFLNMDNVQFILNAGVSLPTGSIDEEDDTPAGQDVQLPYPMQLGSGTVDLLPGITYLGHKKKWSWGSQFMATIRLGENDNDYTLGDRYRLTFWLSRKLLDWLSTSARLDWQLWEDIDGADPKLNPAMVPTADPDLRDGRRIDFLLGANISPSQGKMKNAKLAIEGGFPVYQSLDGPQLETDWLITAGLQWTF